MRTIIASWSGGIDSTGVVAQLLSRAEPTHLVCVTLTIYGGLFGARERAARTQLRPLLEALAAKHGHRVEFEEEPADFLWAFSHDGVEIPTRNKRILDRLVTIAEMADARDIAMGEYIGADSWVVRDHVAGHDADARALGAYLYAEYGLSWRLWTLADFGESRFKADRLQIGMRAIGQGMGLTSNCLVDSERHCGRCYKCVERAAAFMLAGVPDPTDYAAAPNAHPMFGAYLAQQARECFEPLPFAPDPTLRMPTRERGG